MDVFLQDTDETSTRIATSVAVIAYVFVSGWVIATLFLPSVGQ